MVESSKHHFQRKCSAAKVSYQFSSLSLLTLLPTRYFPLLTGYQQTSCKSQSEMHVDCPAEPVPAPRFGIYARVLLTVWLPLQDCSLIFRVQCRWAEITHQLGRGERQGARCERGFSNWYKAFAALRQTLHSAKPTGTISRCFSPVIDLRKGIF